jgi:hypothetical protein
LSDGKIITQRPLQKLVHLSSTSEYKSTYKLNIELLSVTGTERQNVSQAAKLLSHSVAVTLKRYLHDEESINLSDFIQNINDWFDIMNSSNTSTTSGFKKPYCDSFDQKKKLEKIYEMIDTMTPSNKTGKQVFQKGILVSIKSLQTLFSEMSSKYGISYILTYKINQDALENFFSQIRSVGGTDAHPTPLNCIYRIRLLILGMFSL